MSSFQKVIKYCAIAFAVFLAISIISGIASAVFAVVTAISGVKYSHTDAKLIDYSKDFENVSSLDIDHSLGELNIKTGDSFRVEGINVPDDFEAKVSMNGTLNVYEKLHFPWINFDNFNNRSTKITIYLPEEFVANNTEIKCGAGNININALHTKDFKISAGAGNITGSNLTVENRAKFNGGVGNINIDNVKMSDSDFDGGVGNIYIDGILLGDSKIDCGVGEIDMKLQGNREDYNLDVDTGVGSVRINGEKIHGDYNDNRNADYRVKIDGGVGNVDIDFNSQW